MSALEAAISFMNELQEIRKFLGASSDCEKSTLTLVKEHVAKLEASKILGENPAPKEAPLSYVTPEGYVKVPKFVMEALEIENGGGVVFLDPLNKGEVRLLSNKAALALLGEDKTLAANAQPVTQIVPHREDSLAIEDTNKRWYLKGKPLGP